MSEFFLEIFTEEVPAKLQNDARNSLLEKFSNFFIHTSIEREACHNNLAPTSSSSCHLAIGDAIAMTLQKLKGFSPSEFVMYHPSGVLGKQLSLTLYNLIDLNRKPKVDGKSSFFDIVNEISANMYGATAVLNNEKIIGIITDGDIRRLIEKNININDVSALSFMNTNPKTMKSDTLAIKSLKYMQENNISQVLVLDDSNNYIGIVHILDIIKQGISNE